jgi:hypothetical protein
MVALGRSIASVPALRRADTLDVEVPSCFQRTSLAGHPADPPIVNII